MASENFELMITYPDGHVELIEETFYVLEKAVEYGESMMNQIAATEQFHDNKGARLRKPSYEVYKKENGSHTLVAKGKGKKF